MDEVQEIKDRINITDVVGQYVKLERAGRNMRARCPFHKEKTPSFFVSPERGTYICFGCGEKGDIFSFLQKVEGAEFSEVLKQLAQQAGVVLQHTAPAQKKENHERLFAVCAAASSYFMSALAARTDVEQYLAQRGVTPETAAQWQLGYAPASWEGLATHLRSQGFSAEEMVEAGLVIASEKKQGEVYDRFRGRIMFPISNVQGNVIGFSGRFFETVHGSEETDPAKYVNSPETPIFKKSRILYGLDRARQSIRKHDCILLVEGQFDLVMCHQSGLSFTVALSGTALTPEHLQLLGRFSKRLVLALDGDAAGIRAGLKSAYMALQAGFDVKIPHFSEGKDPADLAREDQTLLKTAIRESKTAIEFFLNILQHQAKDARTYKKQVEVHVLPLVSVLTSKIEQAHFIALIAHRLEVPEEAVRAEVEKIRSSPVSHSVERIPTDTTAEEGDLSALDRNAAMILFSYAASSPQVQALAELLGNERVAALEAQYRADAEQFRFSFELLGEDTENTVHSLLQSIERSMIGEEIQVLQRQLRTEEGNATASSDILQKLALLKHRQETLRK